MFDAIFYDGPGNGSYPKTFRIDPVFCEGCGVCAWFCAEKAIEFKPALNGQWFVSETRHGPMVHAKLGAAEENSGKLVTLVRNAAKEIAERDGLDTIIVDGSPGIGCPVIASVTGCDLALAVTEPTLSGLHDLERIADLAGHFGLPVVVVVNKYDLNESMTLEIERWCADRNIGVAGRIPYSSDFTVAMVAGLSVVEYADRCAPGAASGDGEASRKVREIWEAAHELLLQAS